MSSIFRKSLKVKRDKSPGCRKCKHVESHDCSKNSNPISANYVESPQNKSKVTFISRHFEELNNNTVIVNRN